MARIVASVAVLFMFGVGLWTIQTAAVQQSVFAEEAKKDDQTQKPMVRKPTSEEIGQMKICAVAGTKFEVASNTPVIDYKGKTYYFCCKHCLHDFQKDPDKYAK
ncbi:MAG TPA: YHS domain-containing protein [Nitrospiria bacterium]|nr:YHS domain-containing protein [Nitrospiria bacterium]